MGNGGLLHQLGSAVVEYVVVCAVIFIALFVPVPPFNQSVVGWLLESMRLFHLHSTLLLSMP